MIWEILLDACRAIQLLCCVFVIVISLSTIRHLNKRIRDIENRYKP